MRTEVENLKKENAELENKVNDLENQLITIEYINKEFASQEKQLKQRIEDLENQLRALHSEPVVVVPPKSGLFAKSAKSVTPAEHSIIELSESESSDDQPIPPKRILPSREAKGKGKAVTEDEPNPVGARAEMKILMKSIPEEYQLKVDQVFSSSDNKKILGKIIPELLDALAPRFNPSRKQLHEWLGALHRHQRGRHRKAETGKLDADNRRLHANSRLNEVRIVKLLRIYCFMY